MPGMNTNPAKVMAALLRINTRLNERIDAWKRKHAREKRRGDELAYVLSRAGLKYSVRTGLRKKYRSEQNDAHTSKRP